MTIAQTLKKHKYQYLMMVPGLALGGMFVFYPIFAAIFYALHDWSGFNADRVFVGVQNFVNLFQDPIFWDAFRRSLRQNSDQQKLVTLMTNYGLR